MNLNHDIKEKILELLRENNLQETAKIFLQESECQNEILNFSINRFEIYSKLFELVDSSLDKYKAEFYNLLYPIFVYFYIELLDEDCMQAQSFYRNFYLEHVNLHGEDFHQIMAIRTKEQSHDNPILSWFRSHRYLICLSKETFAYMRYQLTKNNLHEVTNKMDTCLKVEVLDEVPRSKGEIDESVGALEGEADRHVNKTKIYCGLIKESDVVVNIGASNQQAGGDVDEDGGQDVKKRKLRKEGFLLKKGRTDPLGPCINRIPLPELKESDKMLKILITQESLKRYKITPTSLPSVCCYTMLNARYSLTSAVISDDSSLLVVGYNDGTIKIYSLTPQKLKIMKPASELRKLDIHEDDVLNRIMDEKDLVDVRHLMGHTESVTALSISHDKLYVLSSSEDGTVKLWSLLVYKSIVTFKGHVLPVWDVKFGPFGYYFASCGADKTIRLWAMDQAHSLRIFVGHHSDVDVLTFHPNSNYIASGSSDRTVRVWDLLNGACVRIFTGHKSPITALTFSLNGRHLISSSNEGHIHVWDLPMAHLITRFLYHESAVYSLCFDRDGVCLTSGGAGCEIAFWDYKLMAETNVKSSLYDSSSGTKTDNVIPPDTSQSLDNFAVKSPEPRNNSKISGSALSRDPAGNAITPSDYFIKSYRTKRSIVLYIHYTWRNLGLLVTEFCSFNNTSSAT